MMKVDVKKITLLVNGREKSFSEKELIKKLEKLEELESKAESVQKSTEVTQKTNEEKSRNTVEIAQKPTEGKCFEVNPISINQNLFQKKRKDARQEATRQLIIEAFAEMKANPTRYAKSFKTMIPIKTWEGYKTVSELKEIACSLGDHMANWVEQALEWAQRLANGETWTVICNDPDTAKWYRLIVWKNGYAKIVGGASEFHDFLPASDVHNIDFSSDVILDYTVPSVVL